MLIELCVLLAQKICGASILASEEEDVLARDRAEGVLPALTPIINPEAERQVNRMTTVLRLMVTFMVDSFLSVKSPT
jgi:hypothetical protein